ncbi:MAG TPA: hypothetical protein PLR18_01915, partial [bacterium]|nr:hypothetical protein [bacterium]
IRQQGSGEKSTGWWPPTENEKNALLKNGMIVEICAINNLGDIKTPEGIVFVAKKIKKITS